ncbi:MAG: putative rane protein [Deltaproteobacteria bacterium]|nr:putative rane protein [Deltaproteobacteria bacterium]
MEGGARILVVLAYAACAACGTVEVQPDAPQEDAPSTACIAPEVRCNGNQPQACVAGTFEDLPACGTPRNTCAAGACVAPSCADGKQCAGTSCCESISLSTFAFPMGRSTAGSDAFATGLPAEVPEHSASTDDFYLDEFEITVGRFRTFVEAYDRLPRPTSGDGAHPTVAGSGWDAAWNALMPATATDLRGRLHCNPNATWTDQPGPNEQKPINCLTWYELYAFCIFDGGRLPTEVEWEFAASGGLTNRLYPWGAQAPTPELATFGCTATSCGLADIRDVGTAALGAAPASGIRDLAGSMWEWTRDRYSDVWYANQGNTCASCINLDMPTSQGYTIRGGGWNAQGDDLRAVRRDTVIPDFRGVEIAGRCAR